MRSETPWLRWLIALVMIYGYVAFGYFFSRDQTSYVLGTYLVLFAGYLFLSARRISVWQLFLLGLIFRMVLIASLPGLSDDLYRFVWDGRLLNHGINPFAALPVDYFHEGLPPFLNEELYQHLNSPEYFTIYPPVAQYLFLIATWIFPDSVLGSAVVLRLFLLLAETGTFFILSKQCRREKDVAWYWLNPLVILEITGNLHMEGIMIFLLLLTLHLLYQRRISSGISWGLAVATKLNPMLFLPVILRFLPVRKWKAFLIGASVTTAILFLPLFNGEFIRGMFASVSLYFQTFEFNAGLYYVVRWIGFMLKGYNIIGAAAPAMAVIATLLILILALKISIRRHHVATLMGISWLIYLLFSTTVHPWYILPLLMLLLIRGFYFPVLWSLLIFFTYAGYSVNGFTENYYIVGMEYLGVILFAGFEINRYINEKKLDKKHIQVVSSYSTDPGMHE